MTKAEKRLLRIYLLLLAWLYNAEVFCRWFFLGQGWKVRVFTLTEDLRRRVYVRDLPPVFRTLDEADHYCAKIRAEYPGDFRFKLYPNW